MCWLVWLKIPVISCLEQAHDCKMSCLQGFGAGESVTFHSSGLTVKVLGMLDHQLFRPPKLPVHTDILKIGTAYCSVIDDEN